MTDTDLTKMQLDILELESMTWSKEGSKFSEFKQRHPTVTETGYCLALLNLLSNPAAYEYDGQRYAPMLRRLDEEYREALTRRVGLRSVPSR